MSSPSTNPLGDPTSRSPSGNFDPYADSNQQSSSSFDNSFGATSPESAGLASVPMFIGDFFGVGTQIRVISRTPNFPEEAIATSDFPVAGGSRQAKIGENDNIWPRDRLFFTYHHFHNALSSQASDFGANLQQRTFSVDQYTFGMEKAFLCDTWSLEVLVPFTGRYQFVTPNFDIFGGKAGNLAVIAKWKFLELPALAFGTGIGVTLPTGSDASGRVNDTRFTLENRAVHLLPYIGFLCAPSHRFYYQGTLQLDIPTNGNSFEFSDPFFMPSGGKLSFKDQNLLYLDLSAGYWFLGNPPSHCCDRFAAAVVGELHYTTTLNDSDLAVASLMSLSENFGFQDLRLSSAGNRFDVVNLTTGLHFELHRASFRVAGVFPLTSDTNRFFDAEIQVAANLRF